MQQVHTKCTTAQPISECLKIRQCIIMITIRMRFLVFDSRSPYLFRIEISTMQMVRLPLDGMSTAWEIVGLPSTSSRRPCMSCAISSHTREHYAQKRSTSGRKLFTGFQPLTSLSQLTPSSPRHSVKRQLPLKFMFSTLQQLEGKPGQSLGLDNSQQN